MAEMRTSPCSSRSVSGSRTLARAARGGLAPSRIGIVHPQRDIAYAVAVQPHVLGDRVIGR